MEGENLKQVSLPFFLPGRPSYEIGTHFGCLSVCPDPREGLLTDNFIHRLEVLHISLLCEEVGCLLDKE